MISVNKANKWSILIVVLVGSFMTTMDISIVNVALPNMSTMFKVDIDTIQWVVTSYLIVISTLVLMFGRIADIKGKKIIYQNGFLVFCAGSLLCVFSGSIYILILSRVIQGIGASMMMSCNFGIITMSFPENERGRAVGILATIVAIGTMTGPPLGGFLVSMFNWKAIFLVNIPIGIIAYMSGVKILPKEEFKTLDSSLDIKGEILFAGIIIPLFLALENGERFGWGNLLIILSFLISMICIILFSFTEIHSKSPMLDFNLFKNKTFTTGIICAFISYFVIYFTNIIHPFYLQHILSMSPQKAGFIMMVYPVAAAIAAPISGYITDKIGYRIPSLIGLTSTAIGIYSMSFLDSSSTDLSIIIRMAILGIGYGLFQAPNNAGVMSSVSKNNLGISGSVNSLIRNLGMTCGITFSVSLFYSRASALLGHHTSALLSINPNTFVYSMKFIYTLASVFTVVGIIIAFLRLFDKLDQK